MLTSLIKKGGLKARMTATVATPATALPGNKTGVADVATVAVAQTLSPLSPDELHAISAWLADIGETDPVTIRETLEQCQDNAQARAYCLSQASALTAQDSPPTTTQCGSCSHFERTEHPHLGHCAKGEPEALAGLWDTDVRYCLVFQPVPDMDVSRILSMKGPRGIGTSLWISAAVKKEA